MLLSLYYQLNEPDDDFVVLRRRARPAVLLLSFRNCSFYCNILMWSFVNEALKLLLPTLNSSALLPATLRLGRLPLTGRLSCCW